MNDSDYKLTKVEDIEFSLYSNEVPIEFAILQGNPEIGPVAFMLKLPPGLSTGLHSHTNDYHLTVVQGSMKHWLKGEEESAEILHAGSYWFQPGKQAHEEKNIGTEPALLFVYQTGKMDYFPEKKD